MEMQDKVKLVLAMAMVVAGVAGFYLLPEDLGSVRAFSVVFGVLAAAGIVWVSAPGKEFVLYAQDSVNEAKKVVWPARKEATQLTLLVFAFIVVLAAFMWLVDSALSWVFYDLILGRG